jgi:ABC-type Zn uptake system ZnuABC Zn-binding protein ZnuA
MWIPVFLCPFLLKTNFIFKRRETMFIRKLIPVLILGCLLLTACGGSSPAASTGALKVLASTSFLADIAGNVAGDGFQVDSLLPVGADPHAYEATPADVVKISESNVLILNGLEYEHFIESLLENADGERLVIVASTGLEPHEADEHANEAEAEQGHEAVDPHLWLDPNLVLTYVENIRDGLVQADPEGADAFETNADAYITQLKDLDDWITDQVAQIPVERRLLVTNHEALGYFADRYGFSVVGTVIPGSSSGAETSAQALAGVIDDIRASGAPAIFLGEVENPALANQIAAETGVTVVEDLYLESLTDGPPAATYIDMMKYNVSKIVEALK